MNPIERINQLGQSIWLDYIERSFTRSGKLKELIDKGISGITSNPSIFQKAISDGEVYNEQIFSLAKKGYDAEKIYESLVITDIVEATLVMEETYEASGGKDGFVSLEIDPYLAYNTERTISEADRLFQTINKKNLLIKVPATNEGIPAIKELISRGININITLIFSLEQYEQVIDAYLSGLEKRLEMGEEIANIHSVASFFVSRLDAKVDKMLADKSGKDLEGRIALSNSAIAYKHFQGILSSKRWKSLARKKAVIQRLLWASTSTKNPSYSSTLYVDNLIAPHTVNTIPTKTLEIVMEKAEFESTLESYIPRAERNLNKLSELNINLSRLNQELLVEGVKKFQDAYDELLNSIREKIK